MELIIKNHLIITPINVILEQLKREINGNYLKDIKPQKGDSIMITCPYHKNGQENHPSCSVYTRRDNPEVYYGTVHCFTCGKSVPLYALIGYCFEKDDEFGKEWLLARYGNVFIEQEEYLLPIELEKPTKNYLDESILKQYSYFHPYMFERGFNEYVIRKFKIGFDINKNAITFPIWDSKGRLVGITERCVDKKKFYIPENIDKPVYLLNYILKENIDTVWVCESQINTLLCWKRGRPAIGLIGTGTKQQYEILKKSGIRTYFLALDGDEAGDKGIIRFKNNMPSDIIINVINIPRGKDIGDLSDEEFEKLTYRQI